MTFTSGAARAWTPSRPARPSAPGPRSGGAGDPLSVTLERTGATTVLTMVGRFDAGALRAVEGLVDRICCTVTDHLAVDAGRLDQVDEVGVRILAALDCYMRARGGRLTVVDAVGPVGDALRAAGLVVRSANRPGVAPSPRGELAAPSPSSN